MARLTEFQTITSTWDTVDKEFLKPLLHHDQPTIRHCLELLNSLDPILSDIEQRNPQAASELFRANAERKNHLNELIDQFINEEGTYLQQELLSISTQLSQPPPADPALFPHLSSLLPKLLDISFLSAQAATELGSLFVDAFAKHKHLCLHKTGFHFSPSEAPQEEQEKALTLLEEFDRTLDSLLSSWDEKTVEKGVELLSNLSTVINELGQIDSSFGNELTIAFEDRDQKLKQALFSDGVISIHSLFMQFDEFYPNIPPNDLNKINEAIGILNECSPKINHFGSNFPAEGNHYSTAYTVRMDHVVGLGKKLAGSASK